MRILQEESCFTSCIIQKEENTILLGDTETKTLRQYMQVPTNIRKDRGVRAIYLAEIVDFSGKGHGTRN